MANANVSRNGRMKITVQGNLVDISHLAPITLRMNLDLRGGKQKKNAFLEISFSNHCYSRGPAEGEAIPIDMFIADGSKHMPRNRIFCWNRYRHSLDIARKVGELVENNGEVCKSRHQNFFSTTLVVQDENGNRVEVPYYIFISARKAREEGKPQKLVLYVESAYPDSPSIPSPVGQGGPMPLSEMLGKVWDTGSI
jgi:hypothetical protein